MSSQICFPTQIDGVEGTEESKKTAGRRAEFVRCGDRRGSSSESDNVNSEAHNNGITGGIGQHATRGEQNGRLTKSRSVLLLQLRVFSMEWRDNLSKLIQYGAASDLH